MKGIGLALTLWQAITPAPAPAAAPERYPFEVGETLTYSAKLGMLTLGQASLQVVALDTVRGAETFVFRFRLWGKTPFYELDDRLESWTGTADFNSRRFRQDYLDEKKNRDRTFEIFPDRNLWVQRGRDTAYVSAENPLDDTSFFYFLRITELEVGRTYVYRRYFKKEKNPIRVTVEKREIMEMPDGSEVPCLVLRPVVETSGMFSRESDTRLWLTDDARRLPVQIRSRFKFGTVTLRLEDVALPGVRAARG